MCTFEAFCHNIIGLHHNIIGLHLQCFSNWIFPGIKDKSKIVLAVTFAAKPMLGFNNLRRRFPNDVLRECDHAQKRFHGETFNG